jgi:hypothetical protein
VPAASVAGTASDRLAVLPAPSDGLEKFAVTPAGSPATDSCARPVNGFTPVLANWTISDAAPPGAVISSAGLATIWKSCSCLTVKVGPLDRSARGRHRHRSALRGQGNRRRQPVGAALTTPA